MAEPPPHHGVFRRVQLLQVYVVQYVGQATATVLPCRRQSYFWAKLFRHLLLLAMQLLLTVHGNVKLVSCFEELT